MITHLGVKLEVTDAVRELIGSEGYDPHYGARPIRRAVQRLIEDPLSEEVLLGRFGEGDTIVAELDDDNHIHFARGDGETRELVGAGVDRMSAPTLEPSTEEASRLEEL